MGPDDGAAPTVRIRSRFQIETRTRYALQRDRRATHATIEAFLFVPRILGINAQTYPRYLFYRDIQTISELGIKPIELDQLLEKGAGPIAHLRDSVQAYADNPKHKTRRNVETQIRIFGRVLGDSIRAYISRVDSESDVARRLKLARQFLVSMSWIRDELGTLGATVEPAVEDSARHETFALFDEYVSLLIEQSSLAVRDHLQDLTGTEANDLRGRLLTTAHAETSRRHAPICTNLNETSAEIEHSVFRLRAVRTYVDSVLSLDTRHEPEGRIAQELLLSLAAGFAMVFATAVAFLAHVRYENWTSAFFVILVISYMFKDRIKALIQDYLRNKQQRFFYDFRTKIYGEATRDVIGIQRESFGFVDAGRLEAQILALRNRNRLSSFDNEFCGETVTIYKRRTAIYSLRFSDVFQGYPVEGVNEIIRFDLTRFGRKMEDAESHVYVPMESGYKKLQAQEVYHLNLLVKHNFEKETVYYRFRIVMSRDGIRRIERIGA